MKILTLSILFSMLSAFTFGQTRTFEIFGTITGEYNSKIYFFYDNNYKQKDSISSEIKDGKFYFKATASLPIQARFHLDQQSFIQDIYIDGKKILLTCSNHIKIYGKDNDTMNMFAVTGVKGSNVESLKRNFENWLTTLKASDRSEEEKNQEYYNKLYEFARSHPKSKVSAYLIAKASTLHYSQVNTLNCLMDASLQNTFEGKSATLLLNKLDKSKNKSIGKAFLDVTLKDSSGTEISTKDLRGKYVLIDFWASWCKPCREINPALKSLYNKLKDKSFEILGVSFDKEQDRWKQAIIKDGLPWKQVIDENGVSGVLGEYYDIEAIPESILLDKDGKIIGAGLSVKEVEEMIQRIL